MNIRKIKFFKILCITISLIVIFGVFCFGISKFKKLPSGNLNGFSEKNDVLSFIAFYTPDFEENILENPEYAQKNSYIRYTVDGVSVVLTEGKESTDDEYAKFFSDYFDCLKFASSKHKELFAPDYKHSYTYMAKPDETFAPQMVYDIEVLRFTPNEDLSAKSDTQYAFFEVRYKIYHNNGTYRRDLPENAVKPLLFELSNKGGDIKIFNISDFSDLE